MPEQTQDASPKLRLTDTIPKPMGADIERLLHLTMIGAEADINRDIRSVVKHYGYWSKHPKDYWDCGMTCNCDKTRQAREQCKYSNITTG